MLHNAFRFEDVVNKTAFVTLSSLVQVLGWDMILARLTVARMLSSSALKLLNPAVVTSASGRFSVCCGGLWPPGTNQTGVYPIAEF